MFVCYLYAIITTMMKKCDGMQGQFPGSFFFCEDCCVCRLTLDLESNKNGICIWCLRLIETDVPRCACRVCCSRTVDHGGQGIPTF
jgi:hypothetical protein